MASTIILQHGLGVRAQRTQAKKKRTTWSWGQIHQKKDGRSSPSLDIPCTRMRKALLSGLPIQSGCACDSLEFGGASVSPERTVSFPLCFVSSGPSSPICHELDDRPLTVWPVLVSAPGKRRALLQCRIICKLCFHYDKRLTGGRWSWLCPNSLRIRDKSTRTMHAAQ